MADVVVEVVLMDVLRAASRQLIGAKTKPTTPPLHPPTSNYPSFSFLPVTVPHSPKSFKTPASGDDQLQL